MGYVPPPPPSFVMVHPNVMTEISLMKLADGLYLTDTTTPAKRLHLSEIGMVALNNTLLGLFAFLVLFVVLVGVQ